MLYQCRASERVSVIQLVASMTSFCFFCLLLPWLLFVLFDGLKTAAAEAIWFSAYYVVYYTFLSSLTRSQIEWAAAAAAVVVCRTDFVGNGHIISCAYRLCNHILLITERKFVREALEKDTEHTQKHSQIILNLCTLWDFGGFNTNSFNFFPFFFLFCVDNQTSELKPAMPRWFTLLPLEIIFETKFSHLNWNLPRRIRKQNPIPDHQ